jgi:hypothetical protein
VLTFWWKPWGFVGSYGNEVISTLAEEQKPKCEDPFVRSLATKVGIQILV